ncbi:MAG TPA: hypothetical protein VM120_15515 [Bryobacteraceae bacterium]|nr:hypothetical protein [Bryobacteraceae bacterium]
MPIPVRLAGDDVFDRVRALFRGTQFQEDLVESRSTDKDHPFPPFEDGMVPADADAAGLLIGLFLRGGRATEAVIREKLGAQGLEDLRQLGLLKREGDHYGPTVRIRPMYGLYVISDLWNSASGPNPTDLADDVVFPPDIPNTLTYLSYLPLDPCGKFLEACGGSGVGALVLAQHGTGHAWAFDITERSTAYAAFNARLNGLKNFTAACGDTFEPANGILFDRIAAHPPYVPVLKHTWIYHAGGNDGEQITRKHVQDLHKVLAPGGRFYCRCLGSDRLDSPFEKRIREWLGEHSDEFDVALHVIRVLEPVTYIMASLMRGRSNTEDIAEWERQFSSIKLFRFLASVLVIQRRAEERPVFTVRRGKGLCSGPRELEWMIRWETLRAQGCEDIILDSKLKAGPVIMHLREGVQNGRWVQLKRHLEVNHPYFSNSEVDALGAYLVPKADGTKTGREIFQGLIDEGAIGGSLDPRLFARSMADLVSNGFITVEGHEPPRPSRQVEEEI